MLRLIRPINFILLVELLFKFSMINFSHNYYFFTRGETRTLTPKVLVPKTSASTNSAISQNIGWMMGFEPTTTGTTNQGSTTELHPPLLYLTIRAWKDSNLRPYRS